MVADILDWFDYVIAELADDDKVHYQRLLRNDSEGFYSKD
jgi:hypothetical protein